MEIGLPPKRREGSHILDELLFVNVAKAKKKVDSSNGYRVYVLRANSKIRRKGNVIWHTRYGPICESCDSSRANLKWFKRRMRNQQQARVNTGRRAPTPVWSKCLHSGSWKLPQFMKCDDMRQALKGYPHLETYLRRLYAILEAEKLTTGPVVISKDKALIAVQKCLELFSHKHIAVPSLRAQRQRRGSGRPVR